MVDGVANVKAFVRMQLVEGAMTLRKICRGPVDSAASCALTSAPMNKTLILVVGLRVGKAV